MIFKPSVQKFLKLFSHFTIAMIFGMTCLAIFLLGIKCYQSIWPSETYQEQVSISLPLTWDGSSADLFPSKSGDLIVGPKLDIGLRALLKGSPWSWIGFALSSAILLFCAWLLWQVRQVIQLMLKGQPFHDACIRKMKQAGQTILGGCVAVSLIEMLAARQILKEIAVPVGKLSVNTELPAGWIACGIVLILCSEVFRYGRQLEEDAAATI